VNRVLKIGRKWLYIVHRWVGIAACLLFAIWFLSGLVMMYVPYPSLSQSERLAGLAPINWRAVKLGPTEAMAKAGLSDFPSKLTLEMASGEPVYRMNPIFRRLAVSAVDGRRLEGVPPEQGQAIARSFSGLTQPAATETIERDQWTVAGGFDAHRPLYRVRFEDPAGTVLYVSSNTGEVVQDTTRGERFWNWLGSVPHWIYLTVIRTDQPLWRQVILWTSGVGIVGAVTGIWVGILRLRLRRRYAKGRVTPYHGWLEWHHIGGLVTGLTLTTWIVSGWLSVNPFEVFRRSDLQAAATASYAGHDGPTLDADLARLSAAAPGAREVRFRWEAGRPLAVVSGPSGARAALDARTGAPAGFSDALLFDNARKLMPGARLAAAERLTAEDVYWYGHHGAVTLPVLRARFADAARTWVHIDPLTGEVLGVLDANGRAERWWFNFLHDLDLPVLLQNRPVWDILVWALSIGGTIISVSGVVIGWRRLKRKVAHARAPKLRPRPLPPRGAPAKT
jgi:hypothetical protein